MARKRTVKPAATAATTATVDVTEVAPEPAEIVAERAPKPVETNTAEPVQYMACCAALGGKPVAVSGTNEAEAEAAYRELVAGLDPEAVVSVSKA